MIQGPKQGKPLPRVIKQSDMERLLSVTLAGKRPEDISAIDLRDQALLELLYAAGLVRFRGILGLLCSQVFTGRSSASCYGQGIEGANCPTAQNGMSGACRYFSEGRPALMKGPSPYVFLSSKGNPMSTNAIRAVFKRALGKAGLDLSLTPHAMRHSFATDLLAGELIFAAYRRCWVMRAFPPRRFTRI